MVKSKGFKIVKEKEIKRVLYALRGLEKRGFLKFEGLYNFKFFSFKSFGVCDLNLNNVENILIFNNGNIEISLLSGSVVCFKMFSNSEINNRLIVT